MNNFEGILWGLLNRKLGSVKQKDLFTQDGWKEYQEFLQINAQDYSAPFPKRALATQLAFMPFGDPKKYSLDSNGAIVFAMTGDVEALVTPQFCANEQPIAHFSTRILFRPVLGEEKKSYLIESFKVQYCKLNTSCGPVQP